MNRPIRYNDVSSDIRDRIASHKEQYKYERNDSHSDFFTTFMVYVDGHLVIDSLSRYVFNPRYCSIANQDGTENSAEITTHTKNSALQLIYGIAHNDNTLCKNAVNLGKEHVMIVRTPLHHQRLNLKCYAEDPEIILSNLGVIEEYWAKHPLPEGSVNGVAHLIELYTYYNDELKYYATAPSIEYGVGAEQESIDLRLFIGDLTDMVEHIDCNAKSFTYTVR